MLRVPHLVPGDPRRATSLTCSLVPSPKNRPLPCHGIPSGQVPAETPPENRRLHQIPVLARGVSLLGVWPGGRHDVHRKRESCPLPLAASFAPECDQVV